MTVPPSQRRPQPTTGGGHRALLVAPRDHEADAASIAAALDTIRSLGYDLIGVVDPSNFREAHRLVAEGLADVIVVARMEHLTSVRVAAPGGRTMTMPVLRSASVPAAQPGVPASQRRPQRTQLIDRDAVALEAPAPPAPMPPPVVPPPAARSHRRRLARRHAG